MERDRNGMDVLSRQECLQRLGTGGVGRIAVSIGALPAVFPINYATIDGDVVFRTTPGTKLAAATRNAVVAFEVDDIDRCSHTGWSVMVVGTAHEVTDTVQVAALQHLPVVRWSHGDDPESIVRIEGVRISGRRLTNDAPTGNAERNGYLPFPVCPACGSDALAVVSDGELANIVCNTCFTCWHFELGAVYPIPAASCPSCQVRPLCTAAHTP